jgi:hypothetical protein
MNAAMPGGVQVEETVAGKPSSPFHSSAIRRSLYREARQRYARSLADRRAATTRRAGTCPPSAPLEDES